MRGPFPKMNVLSNERRKSLCLLDVCLHLTRKHRKTPRRRYPQGPGAGLLQPPINHQRQHPRLHLRLLRLLNALRRPHQLGRRHRCRNLHLDCLKLPTQCRQPSIFLNRQPPLQRRLLLQTSMRSQCIHHFLLCDLLPPSCNQCGMTPCLRSIRMLKA